jgi:hypothetical protein
MSAAVLQLHRRPSFEKNATLALGVGAAAGLMHAGLATLGVPVPLAYLGTVAAVVACIRGDRMDRLLLLALAVVAPGVPWLLGMAPAWTVALGAGSAGLLMVRAHLCDVGEEGAVGGARPGAFNYAAGGVLAGALGLGGAQVAVILGARLGDLATPLPIAAAACGAVVALFVVLGSLPAHLALRADPVEARCEELLPTLSGDFQVLAARALELYRRCGQALERVSRSPHREELARTLSEMTRGAVELAAEWSGVEHQLEERTQQELDAEILDLEQSATRCRDDLARRQLELAAAALREERDRVEELKLRRERILAKLKAEVALLERARVSLICIRSGQAQLRSAELSALARRFASLSQLQGTEARLADELAASEELAHHEAERERLGA